MAAPRVLLDENVSPDLAPGLRARGFDAVHVADVGLKNVDDDVVFEWARREGRAVLTQNARHFVPLVTACAERGESYPGLLLTRLRSTPRLLARTRQILSTRTAEDLCDAIVWVQ